MNVYRLSWTNPLQVRLQAWARNIHKARIKARHIRVFYKEKGYGVPNIEIEAVQVPGTKERFIHWLNAYATLRGDS